MCFALLLPGLFIAVPSVARAWEVRYAQHGDQTAEWTRVGRVPAWQLDWVDRERPEVTWQDAEDGRFRGWMFFAKPVQLPDPLPRRVALTCEYRTHCDIDGAPGKRSGVLYVFALTPSAWQALAAAPEDATVLRPAEVPGLVAWGTMRRHGDDVPDWSGAPAVELGQAWRSLGPGAVLWIGVAWGAYHFSPEWGGVRNIEITMETDADMWQRFWAALDVERPELSAVRRAVERGDQAEAEAGLAAYLRQRETPVSANPVRAGSERVTAAADLIMGRTYRLVGCPPYTFPGEIVWNADPSNYDQWAIALNRHSHWLTLASAYLRTGDEGYAQEWRKQVNSWIDAMPVHIGRSYIQGPYNEAGRSALSLDAGIRMGQTWFPSFEVFRRSSSVDDATLVRFVRSCWEHALYLMREENFRRGSNWGAMECNGLYHIATLLPEFRDAPAWQSTAVQRLMGELDYQVYPDGAQVELTPGYHGVSLRNFLMVLKLARANGAALPPEFVASLERMFDYYLRIAMPDLRTPALNDSGRGGIQGWFRDGVELFPDRADFVWVQSSRGAGSPPGYLSTAMPYAGWVVMRTGWTPEDSYMLFDAGPFGTGHQHEDKLSLILYAHGRELLADPGNYAYDTSAWRRYVLSTRAHSTVRVDGEDQACRRDRSEYRAAEPDTHGFVTQEHFDYARDTHTAGYGSPPSRAVVHRRRILFVKPHYWLVVDDLASRDEEEHTAAVQFVVNASGGALAAESLLFTSAAEGEQGGRLAILPLCGGELTGRIAEGEEEPEVRGFIPEGYDRLRPVPAVIYSTRFRGRCTVVSVLLPFAGREPPLAWTSVRSEGGELRAGLRRTDGEVHRLVVSESDLSFTAPGRAFAASEDPLLPTQTD